LGEGGGGTRVGATGFQPQPKPAIAVRFNGYHRPTANPPKKILAEETSTRPRPSPPFRVPIQFCAQSLAAHVASLAPWYKIQIPQGASILDVWLDRSAGSSRWRASRATPWTTATFFGGPHIDELYWPTYIHPQLRSIHSPTGVCVLIRRASILHNRQKSASISFQRKPISLTIERSPPRGPHRF
jgi:hypothetical protein